MRKADEQETRLDRFEVQDSITALPVWGVEATKLHAILTSHSRCIQLDIPFAQQWRLVAKISGGAAPKNF
jgi:hypothetical protein